MKRQIIAMGGGGFSDPSSRFEIDRYVIEQSGKPRPVVCFIPTASGDAENYVARFREAYAQLDCEPRILSLFHPPPDIPGFLGEADVIYVGGGNTRNMLAVWREWGVDRLVATLYQRGVVLCGLSAGAICWFEFGHTDSAGPLAPMKCLGYLKGSCTPHYNGEPERRPDFLRRVGNGDLPNGLALDDGAAVHFVDEEFHVALQWREGSRARRVRLHRGEVLEEEIASKRLSPA